MIWAPLTIPERNCILVLEDNRPAPDPYFGETILLDSVRQHLARDPGYIYLRKQPKVRIDSVWRLLSREAKAPYRLLPHD